LNPRPEIFHTGIYILSSDFSIRLFKSPPNSIFERLSCMVLAVSDAGGQKQHPCKVDALIGFAEKIRQNGSRLSGYGVCIIVCDYVFPTVLREGEVSACNRCFFIPVEAVSPPYLIGKELESFILKQ